MAKLKAIKNQAITEGAQSDDFLKALQYVQYVELEGNTITAYAEHMHIDRGTVYQWQIKWNYAGLLVQVRLYLGSLITESVTVASRKAILQWEHLALEMIRLSLHSNSEFVRMQSIAWVYEHLVEPFLTMQEDPGAEPRAYLGMIAGNARVLNPLSVAEEADTDDPEDEALARSFEPTP